MDGDGSSSGDDDVSSTAAADEGLTLTPPTDLYFTEEEDALHRLYVRTRRRRRRRRTRRTRRRRQLDREQDAGAYGEFILRAVPASGVAIACLPETTVGGEGETRESGGECAVCLEEYAAGDAVRTMPCAHGFHERCIVAWLRASRLCPLCRFALPPAEEEDTATDDDGERALAPPEEDTETTDDEDSGEREADAGGHDNGDDDDGALECL